MLLLSFIRVCSERGERDIAMSMSSFSFFSKPSKTKSASEIVKATRFALLSLRSSSAIAASSSEKVLEEVEKNLVVIKQMLLGDADTEPNNEQITQIVLEVCKEDFIELLLLNLPMLSWDARKDSVNIWGTLLRQKVGSSNCCLEYIENHTHLLEFLVLCYQNKEVALNAGNILRDCARYPTITKFLLESSSFDLFFDYVELSNFDIASDAFMTFKDLLTRHELLVAEYLSSHYVKFFGMYERLLTSVNYVTRRQSLKLLGDILLEKPHANVMMQYISEVRNLRTIMMLLKDTSKNIQLLAFHMFKVFVANPRKPSSIVKILLQNRSKLLAFLEEFHLDKEDEQFHEEKELLIKELEGLTEL